MKIRLAITGSGGYLANWLIERLDSEAECEFILGLDIRPRAAVPEKRPAQCFW
jgi:hypothetical protein